MRVKKSLGIAVFVQSILLRDEEVVKHGDRLL